MFCKIFSFYLMKVCFFKFVSCFTICTVGLQLQCPDFLCEEIRTLISTFLKVCNPTKGMSRYFKCKIQAYNNNKMLEISIKF